VRKLSGRDAGTVVFAITAEGVRRFFDLRKHGTPLVQSLSRALKHSMLAVAVMLSAYSNGHWCS
jgi:hypothetical protein